MLPMCVTGRHMGEKTHNSTHYYQSLLHYFNITLGTLLVYLLTRGLGQHSSYGLDGPEIESRLGARFPAPVRTGPGTHPACCRMDTGSLPGVKRSGD